MYLCRTFMSFLKVLSLKQVSRSRLPFVALTPLHVFYDLGTDRVTGLQWMRSYPRTHYQEAIRPALLSSRYKGSGRLYILDKIYGAQKYAVV
jgi:hypothetical protein